MHTSPLTSHVCPHHLSPQERQKCSLRTDSILLREMVEELRRDRKQLGTRQESVPGALAGTAGSQGQEDRGHNVRFQDVLKYVTTSAVRPLASLREIKAFSEVV